MKLLEHHHHMNNWQRCTECEICHAISRKADHVTTADVYQCRSRCVGTISTCVQRLQVQRKQNACSSWHNISEHLTTAEHMEPLQLVLDDEYLTQITADKCCNAETGSRVNNSAETSETLNKVFIQPVDVPATTEEHITHSTQIQYVPMTTGFSNRTLL